MSTILICPGRLIELLLEIKWKVANALMNQEQKAFVYVCIQCTSLREIKLKDPIRCTDCGNRVLRKKRTDEVVQMDAV
jgi:DNA-directed RNA polymerase I, II, and III subunit RPABC4